MSEREEELYMKLALAAKDAGMLDAELPPLEMVMQGKILCDALEAQGLSVSIDERDDG